jgi:hypothetical protein
MGKVDRKDEQKPLGYPGRIFLWEGDPMDCILLDVSKGGATLSVDDIGAIPDTFVLMLSPGGGVRRKCKVVRRSTGEIAVQFV